ncbi:MAG: PQQ-binding-like beta-propeller repeat protein [Candidatus Bathyarchaeota archaeon]|nr:PQQ-binding-like beta-propeller repeat protein [Candidatus Bathyarchaeota archaeon]
MDTKKQSKFVITTIILTMLLLSSTMVLCSSAAIPESVTARSLSPTTDYGDIMQYDWPLAQSDEESTGSNAGPAPDRANVLWSVSTSGSGMVSVFNGKAFVASRTRLLAYDALTGSLLYDVDAPGTPSPNSANPIFKLDDTYLLVQGTSGIVCRLIDTGEAVWNLTIPNAFAHPGSAAYFSGRYSTSMKQYIMTAYDTTLHQAQVVGYDLSDPSTEPSLAWTYISDASCELLCCGDGKVFLGTTEASVYAIDSTGTLAWRASTLGGIAQQAAIYYNHKLYISADTWQIGCFDGETGEMLWQAYKGDRAFSAYRGAAGAGMIFESTVELDPYGTVGAWDAETGERLWKQPAYFNIHYATMAYADGKVYGIKCDRPAGSQTGGLVMPGTSTSCWDAYTGTELWNLPDIGFSTPSIAYGNLYGISGGTLYCIGGEPADWNYGLIGNVENQRVAVGQQGPADISIPKWAYQTGGDVFSSPAVADGKVYVGSEDQNLYCLNAYTGEKIWDFPTGFSVRASPAVYNGKVFTGADDGYFYALDADTGEQLWKTSAGGFFPDYLSSGEAEPRSSPIVVNNRIYCGSLDGKVYCLNPDDGNVLCTYTTGGPIFGSPVYSDDTIFITSGEGCLYALNAADLSFKWKSFDLGMDIQAQASNEFYATGTAVIGDGVAYIGGGIFRGMPKAGVDYAAMNMSMPGGGNGGGIRYFAFNATTGASIWNQTRSGNTQPLWTSIYWNGQIYASEFFELTVMDPENPDSGDYLLPDYSQSGRLNGNRTMGAWLGYQIQSSPAYADDKTGAKIYIGCDIGSIYCLNATDLSTLSVFTCGGNVPCSPAVWDGKMYIGATTGKVYCFDDSPTVDFSLFAAANKGEVMWNNETITIGGRLTANPMELVWTDGVFVPEASNYHPGLPNAEVQLSLTKPDGTDQIVTATTNQTGYFTFSYNPTTEGEWGWVIYYEGKRTSGLTYNPTNSEWNTLTVDSAPNDNQQTPSPAQTVNPTSTEAAPTSTQNENANALPMEYVYASLAVIVVVIVVAAAYVYNKQRKK